MQPLVTTAQWTLLAKGQQPKVKLEIEIAAGVWINLCSLWDPAAGKLKNYLKDISFSSGGARMTSDPIAGEFSAVINNKGNIFHPNHPNSGRQGYFRAGRKVRISLGGNYPASGPWAGGDEYWQRIIGHMDEPEFSSDTFELTIKGLDYMRVLSDIKFDKEVSTFGATPIDNMWGGLQSRNSLPTVTFGAQLYAPPGGDAGALPADEANNVANWIGGLVPAVISAAVGTISAWEIKFDVNANPRNSSIYNAVCNVAAGTEYQVTFRYARTAGTSGGGKHLRFTLYSAATAAIMGGSGFLDPPTNGVYETCTFSFTPNAADAGNLNLFLGGRCFGNAMTWRIDDISIRSVTPPVINYYAMPAGCTGIYHVELDGVAQWPGKQKGEGWYYDIGTNRFWFDIDKVVDAGVNNLDIYYYTPQMLEWVVSDILVKSGVNNYANRAAAWADMGNPPTGLRIDRVWFKAGTTYTEAIKKICERCEPRGWTFYFDWNGKPRFVPIPAPGVAVFVPLLPQHIASPKLHQDTNEIRNKIVIEGEKRAELVGWEENMPSELKDEASDNASIITYGEHTRLIKNDLFQDLASITNMCTNLLAEYKDPKWYFDFDMPYNAVPFVLGDTIQVSELLDINLAIGIRFAVHTCIIREADMSLYDVTYRCQI